MERAVYKIGQEVEITEDFEFETMGGRKFKVKDGDKGILTSRGTVMYTTGNAKGIIQKADCDLKGYDVSNIANMIYERISRQYAVDEFLEDEDIKKKDFVEEIEDILSDIL